MAQAYARAPDTDPDGPDGPLPEPISVGIGEGDEGSTDGKQDPNYPRTLFCSKIDPIGALECYILSG